MAKNDMTITYLPEERLRINPAYQRNLNKAHIDKIVSSFDHRLVNPLRVWKTDDSDYEVMDGQHTLEVLRGLGWGAVPCLILNGDTGTTEAASYFVKLNTGRKALRPLEVFNAALTAKQKAAVDINDVVCQYGLRVAGGVPNGIAAIKRLERIYRDGGKKALSDVLYVVTRAWDDDDRDRLQGDILVGIHFALTKGDGPSRNLDRVAAKLRKKSPTALIRQAAVNGDHARGVAMEREINKAIRSRSRSEDASN